MQAQLEREYQTIQVMTAMYCRRFHQPGGLCVQCSGILLYARKRLEHCTFGIEKPACKQCPIHCYAREQRSKMKDVMRWAGPRMIWHHPIMAVRHLAREQKGKHRKVAAKFGAKPEQ